MAYIVPLLAYLLIALYSYADIRLMKTTAAFDDF
jgi:hypothetical protein